MSTTRGMDKEDVVYTYPVYTYPVYVVYRGYYSAIHKSGIMLSAVTWMYLEMVILIEVSQTEKEKYHMISLI